MQPFLAAITLLLSLVINGADNKCTIKGKVVDSTTHEPLFGVYVIYGKELGTTTDKNGDYLIRTDSGNVNIIFHFIGYKSVTRSILVKSNDTIVLNIGMEMEIQEIDQVVVSAARKEQKVSELTVSMDVIKADFLSESHITDAQELINKTQGIEVLDGQASIRGGSGFSYGVGSRVLALVDGLPMMAADGGNIRWNFLPLENISQIEIIKGASSVLYGSSALNGIINFTSADASNVPVSQFFVETGIFDKPKNKEWAWWNSPRIFSSASFSHLQKLGNTDFGIGINLLDDNGYRKFNDEKLGRLNLRLKNHSGKVEGLEYGLNLNSGDTYKTDFILWEDAYSGALKQDTSSVSRLHGTYFSADPFISLNKKGRFRHDLRMRVQSSANKFPVRVQNDAKSLAVYSEYQLWYKLFDFMNVTAGASENYSKIVSNFFGDHKSINLAGFAQVEIRPFAGLKMQAGLRVEQNFLDGVRDKIVPVFRTGLNFKAAEYTFLRASFGQGYRYPSIAEKHAATTLGSVKIIPNPDVQPESGWSSEIGVKQGLLIGELTGSADISIFYSQNSNLIEYIFGLYPVYGMGFQATNVEQSRVYGTEAELLLKRNFGELKMTVSGGYTYIYPVEFNSFTHKNTGVYLKYRRKHTGKFSINSSWKKLEMGFNLYARSKILNIDDVFVNPLTREQILPGFFKYWTDHNTGYLSMDASIGYKLNQVLTLSLVAKNLTNTEYMGRPGDIQPQRNFSIRLSGKF